MSCPAPQGNEVYKFNAMQNIGRTIQVKDVPGTAVRVGDELGVPEAAQTNIQRCVCVGGDIL